MKLGFQGALKMLDQHLTVARKAAIFLGRDPPLGSDTNLLLVNLFFGV